MSTLTTKPAARKVRRRPAAKKLTLEQEILSLVGTRTPPPAKATTADLLRSLHDGTFDAAAAKIDWARVELAYKSRASSSLLRSAKS
jgi:hypothetical protein